MVECGSTALVTPQSKMIFHPVTILLVASLGTLALRWSRKLNPHIFQLEEKKDMIKEEKGCKEGFFCIVLEDDVERSKKVRWGILKK